MDEAATPIRERIWVTKFDHSTDPPTPVEEVFVENGVLIERKQLVNEKEQNGERRKETTE